MGRGVEVVCASRTQLCRQSSQLSDLEKKPHTSSLSLKQKPLPDMLCRAHFNGAVIKLEIRGADPFYECSTHRVYNFSVEVRETLLKMRIKGGGKSINVDRNAKESNKKMPFSSHQIVKDV